MDGSSAVGQSSNSTWVPKWAQKGIKAGKAAYNSITSENTTNTTDNAQLSPEATLVSKMTTFKDKWGSDLSDLWSFALDWAKDKWDSFFGSSNTDALKSDVAGLKEAIATTEAEAIAVAQNGNNQEKRDLLEKVGISNAQDASSEDLNAVLLEVIAGLKKTAANGDIDGFIKLSEKLNSGLETFKGMENAPQYLQENVQTAVATYGEQGKTIHEIFIYNLANGNEEQFGTAVTQFKAVHNLDVAIASKAVEAGLDPACTAAISESLAEAPETAALIISTAEEKGYELSVEDQALFAGIAAGGSASISTAETYDLSVSDAKTLNRIKFISNTLTRDVMKMLQDRRAWNAKMDEASAKITAEQKMFEKNWNEKIDQLKLQISKLENKALKRALSNDILALSACMSDPTRQNMLKVQELLDQIQKIKYQEILND